jgi:hypothetical protein
MIYKKNTKRLFTFGCSFTKYNYPTWADITALYVAPKEYYNFGRQGAGNMYITNMISQADEYFNFQSDDLVIVMWSDLNREDRYYMPMREPARWECHGNTANQAFFKKFTKRFSNPVHSALRDYANIKLANFLLQNKTQVHNLQMVDIVDTDKHNLKDLEKLANLYKTTLNKIAPSFYKLIWDNNRIENKIKRNNMIFGTPWYVDMHPDIYEHKEFVKKVFNIDLSDEIESMCKKAQNKLIDIVRKTPVYGTDMSNIHAETRKIVLRPSDNLPASLII